MPRKSQVIIFGDLTYDAIAGLNALVAIKNNPLLVSFFERTTFALREEIGFLPHAERAGLVQFISFQELLARIKRGPRLHPALEKAVACAHQIGCFISHYTKTGQPYLSLDETHLVGLCTGLLAAAAISCCSTITDLIPIAVHTVLVAFRTGFCVYRIRCQIDSPDGPPAAWSALSLGLEGEDANRILAKFNEDSGLPAASKAYISTYAYTGATVSGPPSTLDMLLRSGYLPRGGFLKIPIYAPYHAPHLYSGKDIDAILKQTLTTEFASYRQRASLIFSMSRQRNSIATFGELMRYALEDILLKPLCLDKILAALAEELKTAEPHVFAILPIATSATKGFITALNKYGLSNLTVTSSPIGSDINSRSGRFEHSKLAIIGYSGRYPDANSNDEFWQLLHDGRDVASITPSNRWDVKTHVDLTLKRKNTSGTPYGCWLKDPGLFDAKFFMLSPREAPQVDPAQRLVLMTTYEAMESAGLVPDATPSTMSDRIGVFCGSTSNDWGETNSAQCVDTYYIPGSCRAFIPGRQNFVFKFSGPSYSIDTACSSGLAALHVGCNALWRGDIDTAICGGTNVMTNPDITAGLDRGHFLSKTGNCNTFDDSADGYCRGEGIGTVIIKRLEDAEADNDPIVGIILSAFTNHSAEAESITRPHVGAQRAIFDKLLTSAAVNPFTVGYIEMHGTGTQAGDAREMESVLSTFAPDAVNPRTDLERLYIGSAKANVGHGESVSGIIALIKSLMMMERNEIPPHCGIKTRINRRFPRDLEQRNVHIALKPVSWPRPVGGVRRILINNFSAAGGNSSVLIEDPPLKYRNETSDSRSTHVIAVSAKSNTALVGNIKSLLSYIANKTPSLPSLSYSTTARRMHHPFRVLVSGSELSEIQCKLERKIESAYAQPRTRATQRIAFAFTGQGCQYIGMGHELLNINSFQQDINRLDLIAQGQGYPSILPLIEMSNGDITDLAPLVVQVGTTCIQMAIARLWKSWGVEPSTVVGHSLGEYAALNAAGVLSDADTIFLVGRRAELFQEKATQYTHAMLAVSASEENVFQLCQGLEFEIACKNAPAETVLSGTNHQIDIVAKVLSSAKIKVTRLRVPFAFHSSQIQPIFEEFKNAARAVRFRDPKVPILSPLLGELLTTSGSLDPTYLARHSRETVNFAGALKAARGGSQLSNAIWVEIGAHPVLSNLLRAILGSETRTVSTLQRNTQAWKTLASSLEVLYEAGVSVQWSEYHRNFADSLSVLRLPSYSWDLKEYWIQYVYDWSLYKGDPIFLQGKAKVSTTCMHELLEEKVNETKMLVVGQMDILREDVDPLVRGHRVNNLPLVTPSIYAEMAFVLGEYLRGKNADLVGSLVDLQDMDVHRPLATKSKGKGPQFLRCRIELELKTKKATVEFWSVTPEGKNLVKHAEASMRFPSSKVAHSEAQEYGQAIMKKMANLSERIQSCDRVQKFTGNTGYQLVSSLATYDTAYKGVSSVVLDSANLEAMATIKFENPSPKGVYHVNPYLIDSFGQPALFVMNANDQADLSKEVFVNHGWKSLHFYKPLAMDKTYRSLVKMSETENDGMYNGDMVVFEGEEVVAIYRGIKAQGVPRRLMDYIVHMRDDIKAGAPNGGTLHNAKVEDVPIQEVESDSKTTTARTDSADSWQAALKIISEESGLSVPDLTPEASFGDLGVDSLLSLLCASRFREELGLHYESSIFLDCPTVGALETFWKGGPPKSDTVSGRDAVLNSMFNDVKAEDDKSSEEGKSSEISSHEITSKSSETSVPSIAPQFRATSLLLQGNPALPSTVKTLFLLPDGSGSCSSYAALPRIHPSIAVVGLNCPFMKIPEQYNCGIEQVSAMYIDEIRRRQQTGPYALGGWSVGGIFAYHIAQQLVNCGQEVTDLVLIDCPVPHGLDHLPRRYYDYCNEAGLFGEVNGVRRDTPKWLITHFEACVNSMHDYHADPFIPESAAPATLIIWATDAVDEHCPRKFDRRPEDSNGLKFLTESRQDFGPCGWEMVLAEENFKFGIVNGANHFSMMRGENAGRLSELIEGFLMRGN